MELLSKDRAIEIKGPVSWKTAVRAGVDILIKAGCATEAFADAIFTSTAKLGAYYVLEKGLALVHAPIGDYSLKPGSSLVLIDSDVVFNEEPEKQAHLLVLFTATDNTSHMALIEEFGHYFTDEDKKAALLGAKTLEDLFKAKASFAPDKD